MDKALNPQEWLRQAKVELDVANHLNSELQDGIDEYRTNRAVAKAAEIWEWASRLLVCE